MEKKEPENVEELPSVEGEAALEEAPEPSVQNEATSEEVPKSSPAEVCEVAKSDEVPQEVTNLWTKYQEVIITFLSGFSAGTVSRTLTAPLDRLKLLMQEGRILQHTMTHPTCHIINSKIKSNSKYSYSLLQLVKLILKEGANQKDEHLHCVEKEGASVLHRAWAALLRVTRSAVGKVSSLAVFWRGNGINCIKAGPEFALAFGTRQLLQQLCVSPQSKGDQPQRVSFGSQFVVSAAAGATAQMIIYPLELIKTRMAVASSGEYSSIFDCIRQTYKHAVTKAVRQHREVQKPNPGESKAQKPLAGKREMPFGPKADPLLKLPLKERNRMRALGMSEFYRGLGANLTGIVPNRGVEMGLFFWLQDVWRQYTGVQNSSEPLPVRMSMLIGATSSTTAQIVTYPLNLVRLRMQVQGMSGRPILYKNMLHCFCSVIRKEGYRGLYRGLLPNLLKGVPSSTVMYVVFSTTKDFLKQNLQ